MADFYLDENVDIALAPELQGWGHTAITTVELGNDTALDAAQLLLAAKRKWILITHNKRDFVVLHDGWRLWTADWQLGVEHAGILVIPQRSAEFWNPIEAAREIDNFLRRGAPLVNELHEFRRNSGWSRREW